MSDNPSGLRRQLNLTQAQLAAQIGAASKTIVYRWEFRKRKPSPVLWKRVERLINAASTLLMMSGTIATKGFDTEKLGFDHRYP